MKHKITNKNLLEFLENDFLTKEIDQFISLKSHLSSLIIRLVSLGESFGNGSVEVELTEEALNIFHVENKMYQQLKEFVDTYSWSELKEMQKKRTKENYFDSEIIGIARLIILRKGEIKKNENTYAIIIKLEEFINDEL